MFPVSVIVSESSSTDDDISHILVELEEIVKNCKKETVESGIQRHMMTTDMTGVMNALDNILKALEALDSRNK